MSSPSSRRPLVLAPLLTAACASLALVLSTGAAAAPGADSPPAGASQPADRPAASTTVALGAGPEQITGPIPATARPGDPSHDYVFYATPFDLRRVGYEELEYFISGTATRYPATLTAQQETMPATPIGTMPYTTRIVVRRPAKPQHSAGIAVVDWQNVTAGHDIDTEWGTSADYFVRHGWTWIGASVQRVGVNGATTGATANLGLKQWNPRRYAALDLTDHGAVTDDSQSFDVYTQIAQLLKDRAPHNPLADLHIRSVYAAGASQSARFLGVYYNTVQPLHSVYDGFLLAIGGSALPPRTDVATKVIRVYTENDILRGAGTPANLVPDTPVRRTWLIAGASHVPAYATGADANDFRATLGGIQTREFGASPQLQCVNPGPSQARSWAVFHAAYEALDSWVRKGVPPRVAPPLAIVPGGPPITVVRDQNGIVLGGIRLPDVEVPTGLNDGVNAPANQDNPLNAFCILYGTHRDFTADQLATLYRDRHDYRQQVDDVLRRLVTLQFVLPEDLASLRAQTH